MLPTCAPISHLPSNISIMGSESSCYMGWIRCFLEGRIRIRLISSRTRNSILKKVNIFLEKFNLEVFWLNDYHITAGLKSQREHIIAMFFLKRRKIIWCNDVLKLSLWLISSKNMQNTPFQTTFNLKAILTPYKNVKNLRTKIYLFS